MIWVRAGLLAVIVGVLVLALTQTTATPAPSLAAVAAAAATPPPEPTRPPTRVPLPTLPPQMVISRVSRDTPAPFATSTPSAEPQVGIVDNGFVPAQMTLRLGTTVLWINGGSDGHDVTGTGPGGDWGSGTLAPMQRYKRSFGLPGTYDYACTIHPEMRGRLVVQP